MHKPNCAKWKSIQEAVERKAMAQPVEQNCHYDLQTYSDSAELANDLQIALNCAYRVGDPTSKLVETHCVHLHFEYNHKEPALRKRFRLIELNLFPHATLADMFYGRHSVDKEMEMRRFVASISQTALSQLFGRPSVLPGTMMTAAILTAQPKGSTGGIDSVTHPCMIDLKGRKAYPLKMRSGWQDYLRRCLQGPGSKTFEEALQKRLTDVGLTKADL
ncbi:hypothetical protein RQP46_004312 [Phenoliferia psychrophenolica]